VQVLRDGKERDIIVKLGRLPEPEVAAAAPARKDADDDATLTGVTVRPLTDRMRAMAQLPEKVRGVLVTGVKATSSAANEGLAEGDVIVQINGQSVTTVEEFQAALARTPDRPVFMRVYKPQAKQNVFLAVPR